MLVMHLFFKPATFTYPIVKSSQRRMRPVITLLLTLLLTSCSEISTTDPVEAYTYWAGTEPPEDLKVIQARYWQSAHWSKEYVLYLKVKPTDEWWNGFIQQNNLVKGKVIWSIPSDSPEWFQVPDNVTLYAPENNFSDARFFRDNLTGECYIYDMQF